ncbi:MAG: hypothetical protein M1472_02620 [Planctomycetes bacterium]|nr:hypothetical protein [Planctomycetota bacterium]
MNNEQKTIATPTLLSGAQRNVSLMPPGRLITHCIAAAGRAILVAGRKQLQYFEPQIFHPPSHSLHNSLAMRAHRRRQVFKTVVKS